MRKLLFVAAAVFSIFNTQAQALQLDWGGQFWFDNNWLNNYQLSRARPGNDNDLSLINAGSEGYVPGAGEKNVTWYAAFLKLNPKAVVNDSVQIKSEFHLGSPIYGFFGRGFPTTNDERNNAFTSQRTNLTVSAHRAWANLITDFGTIELGRAPIHWGLGAIWNSGDKLFDRYQSTGDMIRLTSKFGNFSVQPALVKMAVGDNVAGANTATGATAHGNDDLTDYDLAVKYDNTEEDFELGFMWTKRTGNSAQRTLFFNPSNAGSTRVNFNLFDFYARKKLGRFSIGGEIPLTSGDIGAIDGVRDYDYKAYAVIVEGGYTSDVWDVNLKLGHVPGQPNNGGTDSKFRALYLHQNYDLGLIMSHYNVYGLANNNPDTVGAAALNSPYDAPLVNTNYVSLAPQAKLDKWTLKGNLILAWADIAAQSGRQFYNHYRRQFYGSIDDQKKFKGWETDLGISFKWDENVTIGWDIGFFVPGGYYEFTNVRNPSKYDTSMMFASQVKAGVSF